MHRILPASIFALTLASLGVVAAAQTAAIPIGKNGDVELAQPTALGTTVLKPGHYRFKHVTQDGQDYLVVSQQEATRKIRTHYGTGPGTEVARVVCQVVPLDGKVKDTALYTRNQPDGSRVVTQIRIRGERADHLVALELKS